MATDPARLRDPEKRSRCISRGKPGRHGLALFSDFWKRLRVHYLWRATLVTQILVRCYKNVEFAFGRIQQLTIHF